MSVNCRSGWGGCGTHVDVSTLAINYRNQLGWLVTEIPILDGALVTQDHGTYLGTGGNPAGVASS